MNLEQKFIELRKAVPHIQKEKRGEVKYKYAKIDDVFSAITPVMNELGVNLDITDENDVFIQTFERSTKYGNVLYFLYQSMLTLEWANAENPEEKKEIKIKAIAWNDDPAKAKGAAWTYALKYYLFEKFTIDMGEDDPDNKPTAPTEKIVSNKELTELYKLGNALGYTNEVMQKQIKTKFGVKKPTDISSKQCAILYNTLLEKAKCKEENNNAK